MSRIPRSGALAMYAFLSLTPLWAQVSTGTIVGVVQDSSGGAIANASVEFTHTATGNVRQARTNAEGQFNAPFMPLGIYTITVAAQGFQTQTLTGIELHVDQTANLRIALQLGSISQSVEVTGSSPLVDSATSSLGQVIDNKQILNMPLNGRNPFALGLLVGNTTPVFGMGSNLPFIGGGGRYDYMDVSLNGADDNTLSNSGSIGRNGIAIIPSVDAVQEFKVTTNDFAAEYGHAAGSVVSATIRSGTNSYHGTLFEFLRNDDFDANNFFTNAAGLSRSPFHQNQFGGTLGGPIVRNRVFLFGDYQGTRTDMASVSSILNIPPAAFRTGDFSQSQTIIYDPGTRHLGPAGTVIATPYPHNTIPSSAIDPTSAAILTLLPQPNFGPPSAVARNYFYQAPRFSNTDQGDARIDVALSQKDNLSGSFSISDNNQPAVGSMPGFIGGGSPQADASEQATLSDVHTFSPALVNELRIAYLRTADNQSGTAQQGASFAQKSGLAVFPGPVAGFPQMTFIYSGATTGNAEFSSWGGGDINRNVLTTEQLTNNLSWTHGRHALKFGGDIRKSHFVTLKGSPFFGQYVFGAIFTSSSDAPGSGLPFADFLLGDLATAKGGAMLNEGNQLDTYFGGYAQDSWKATNRLTLNFGLRYELFTQPIDGHNLGSLFNVQTGEFALPGQGGYSRAMVQGDHDNFGPRLGLAYQLTPKLVIRSAYGIFYAMRDQNELITQFSGSSPNVPTLSFPSVVATQTIKPPITINTPLVVYPSSTSLAGFSPQNPYSVQIKTQSFNNAEMPMLTQFNFDMQYQLITNLLLEASYAGARGRHLGSGSLDENQLPFSAALNGTNTQANRPFPNIGLNVLMNSDIAMSNYNALNLKVEKRLSSGLELLANYSWQKDIASNGTGPSSYTQDGGTAIVMDPYQLSRERAVSPISVAHTVSASASYELPFGPGKQFMRGKGLGPRLFGGWVVNGIFSLRTGFPTDIRTNVLPALFNHFNVASCVAGASQWVQNPGVDGFFNPAAFTVPAVTKSQSGALVTEYGTCGRRVAVGPGSVNLDSSIFKNVFLSESKLLQFRTEFFNITNTPTFFLPSASDATLTCQGPPGAACNASNPAFGKLSDGTATGRQIQFSLKVYF